MDLKLKGKTAIVTGASSGLGVQFATALAREGANLAIVARRAEKLNETMAKIKELGVDCIAVQCDVTKSDEVAKAVKEISAHYKGRIDILVNNAGVGLVEPAETQSNDTWSKTMAANIDGVYYFCREVGKIMLERKYGKIINIGSIHSQVALTSPLSAYATSKGAVLMMTKALAGEWAKHGITVNAIGPGYFPSEMTAGVLENKDFMEYIKIACPMGRPGREGELDGALLYLASDMSSYTTGQIISVDGGWTAI